MNPRVSRSSRAGLEGHRLPDREDRRAAGGRLRARGDRQRHHRRRRRRLRADDRLRRRQVAAVRVREVRGRRRGADDPHEVGRRGDGDRPDVPAGVRQGDALARARRRAAASTARVEELLDAPGDAERRPLRRAARGVPPRRDARATSARGPASTRGSCASSRRSPPTPRRRSPASARSRRSTPAPRSSRRARRTTTRAGSAGAPTRSSAATGRRVVILGSGPEPHRPGHRVRLLLRARGDDRARVRAATR